MHPLSHRTYFQIALIIFIFIETNSVYSQSTPDTLKGVTHAASLDFTTRDGCHIFGPISKVDKDTITIQPYKKPPIIIAITDLLKVQQGDALLFSAISSWRDVMDVHVVTHEAFVLTLRNGKIVKGKPVLITSDTLQLKSGTAMTVYSKVDISRIDYLRVKPSSDTWDYFETEAPEILYFLPESYYRLIGLEGRIPVRLYDASIPETLISPQCTKDLAVHQ